MENKLVSRNLIQRFKRLPLQAKQQGEYNRKVKQGIINPQDDITIFNNNSFPGFINYKPKTDNFSQPSSDDKPDISIKSKKNNKVSEFQKMLISKGYDVGKTGADGIWGKNTQKAYEQYIQDQKLKNLKPLEGVNITSDINQSGKQITKWIPQGQDWKSNLQKTLNLTYLKKGGILVSRNPIKRFKSLTKYNN